jgi:invasion protein IalB
MRSLTKVLNVLFSQCTAEKKRILQDEESCFIQQQMNNKKSKKAQYITIKIPFNYYNFYQKSVSFGIFLVLYGKTDLLKEPAHLCNGH